MIAPLWLSATMIVYCLWVIIHDVSSDWSDPIYGSLLTIGVYVAMQIFMWYPPVMCVIVETAAIWTFIYHITSK